MLDSFCTCFFCMLWQNGAASPKGPKLLDEDLSDGKWFEEERSSIEMGVSKRTLTFTELTFKEFPSRRPSGSNRGSMLDAKRDLVDRVDAQPYTRIKDSCWKRSAVRVSR